MGHLPAAPRRAGPAAPVAPLLDPRWTPRLATCSRWSRMAAFSWAVGVQACSRCSSSSAQACSSRAPRRFPSIVSASSRSRARVPSGRVTTHRPAARQAEHARPEVGATADRQADDDSEHDHAVVPLPPWDGGRRLADRYLYYVEFPAAAPQERPRRRAIGRRRWALTRAPSVISQVPLGAYPWPWLGGSCRRRSAWPCAARFRCGLRLTRRGWRPRAA